MGQRMGKAVRAQRLGQLILRHALMPLTNRIAGAAGHSYNKRAAVVAAQS